jgi:hypothetical protein
MDLDNLVESKLKERLDKIEDKLDDTIKEYVKEYITELKYVIFSELTTHLLDKYKDLEIKGKGNYDMEINKDKINEINI